jgi:hypothetical protein
MVPGDPGVSGGDRVSRGRVRPRDGRGERETGPGGTGGQQGGRGAGRQPSDAPEVGEEIARTDRNDLDRDPPSSSATASLVAGRFIEPSGRQR